MPSFSVLAELILVFAIQAEDVIFPEQLICCNTYNVYSCTMQEECDWNVQTSKCTYNNPPPTEDINICSNDTRFDSCSFTLDNNLDDIPILSVRDELAQHTENQFTSPPQPEIIEIIDGVYEGIGYDLANCILIETDTGIIIIDTLSSASPARHLFNDYIAVRSSQRTDDQMVIEAIILTHYHKDHSMGIGFWYEVNTQNGFSETPTIYANKEALSGFMQFFLYAIEARRQRALLQFGVLMYHYMDQQTVSDKNLFFNSGIGPHLANSENSSFINPDEHFILFDDEKEVIISDVKLLLIHTEGETKDQTSIWYQDKSVLFVGDNFYYAFPNIYSIRGTATRDPKKWINSLDTYIEYNPEYLVGSHTKPISGKDNIQTELILYRDLIAFIHDQTVRYMGKQWLLNDIIHQIEQTLPSILKDGTKQQFYGTIEWSVRAIYDEYMGWFQGDASELYPSNIYDRGEGLHYLLSHFWKSRGRPEDMIESLVTYFREILDAAIIKNNDNNLNYIPVVLKEERYILEMISSLSSFYNTKQCIKWGNLMDLRWEIILNIAERSVSANGRNYLISTYIQERFNLAIPAHPQTLQNIMNNFPIEWVFESLKFRIRPETILMNLRNWKTNIKFVDSGKMFQLNLRNGGILVITEYSTFDPTIIQQYDDSAELIYEMTEIDFKNGLIMDETFVFKGNLVHIYDFWLHFDRPSTNVEGNKPILERFADQIVADDDNNENDESQYFENLNKNSKRMINNTDIIAFVLMFVILGSFFLYFCVFQQRTNKQFKVYDHDI